MSKKNIAIKVDGLSKYFRLGVKEQSHDSIGAAMISMIKSPVRNYKKYRSLYKFDDFEARQSSHPDANNRIVGADHNILWAVRDISFEVEKGEVLGIIGTNGAGKSTLLKLLSRITPPSSGTISMNGRVSSLLEVGTGFHPELTGRENVYLNGTILGMRKVEVDAKFDEIVDFSGVEDFLDTPVKRYSSGMRVRLAFAVAAHLEPEILIVDEVLAVGDANFQKKCLNKMQDAGKDGRTVLFVSHSMQAISRMCERVILLDAGSVLMDGSASDVVSAYLKGERDNSAMKSWDDLATAPGGEVARLSAIRIRAVDGKITDAIDIRQPIGIEIEYEVLKPGYVFMPSFGLFNQEGINICVAIDQDKEWRNKPRDCGRYVSTGIIPGNLLAEGLITVNITLWTLDPVQHMEIHEKDIVAFQVIDSLEGDSARGDWRGNLPGMIRPLLEWKTELKPST